MFAHFYLDVLARGRSEPAGVHDQYALRAFDAHALDYVLEPFDAERLARALGRAKAAVAG